MDNDSANIGTTERSGLTAGNAHHNADDSAGREKPDYDPCYPPPHLYHLLFQLLPSEKRKGACVPPLQLKGYGT
jgi:hypothetical protein